MHNTGGSQFGHLLDPVTSDKPDAGNHLRGIGWADLLFLRPNLQIVGLKYHERHINRHAWSSGHF